MSDSNDIPASSTPSVPTVTDDGTRAAASAGNASVVSRPVHTRSTWTLSIVCDVDGWLLIAGTIVLGVYNSLTAANEHDAVLRKCGFDYAIVLMFLLVFVINVIGAQARLVVSWRKEASSLVGLVIEGLLPPWEVPTPPRLGLSWSSEWARQSAYEGSTMTIPNPVGSGMPDYSGSVPDDLGTVPAYPGTMPGNPYADTQPAPEFTAPPCKALGVTSVCLGVVGIVLCVGRLFLGAYISFDADDSSERAMAPLASIFDAVMIYIPGAIMNIIGLILGTTGRKRMQDPRGWKVYKVGIWMNVIPMILFLAAVVLIILFAMAY